MEIEISENRVYLKTEDAYTEIDGETVSIILGSGKTQVKAILDAMFKLNELKNKLAAEVMGERPPWEELEDEGEY